MKLKSGCKAEYGKGCICAKPEITDTLRVVRLNGGFWGRVLERNRKVTVPHVLGQLKEHGYIRNLEIASGRVSGACVDAMAGDSDVYKFIEGASYCLALLPDLAMQETLDDLIEIIAAAQQPDGYLNSHFSMQSPGDRYKDLHRSHELYCAGHLIEAAVAHVEATGKRNLMDVAVRLADHLDRTFGYGKLEKTSGHQEVELALVRLYKATNEKRYLDLAKYFVDMRGDLEQVKREYSGKMILDGDRTPGRHRPPEYRQDHAPILEQRYATGHAVRAGYLYAAMADIAMECTAPEYAVAAKAIWEDVVSRKIYISGGVGTHQYHDEGFGDAYLLPNTGYCETCGGIAFMLFSHRMGQLTGDSKHADVVEMILYNHFLSSTALSGRGTFYRNPLSAAAARQRPPWNRPPCCPTNVVRIIPQFPRLAYSAEGNRIYVDQFAASTATIEVCACRVQLSQETEYPWDGEITITVTPESACTFALHIRVPGWVDGKPVPSDLYTAKKEGGAATIAVNGELIDTEVREMGYCVIERVWKPGDVVRIDFPMPARRIHAHPNVEADHGRVALMRGPLLYCLEETDVGMDPEEYILPVEVEIRAEHRPDLLGGVSVLTDRSQRLERGILAVPFFAWNNREADRMLVWMREKKQGSSRTHQSGSECQ